MIPRRLIPLFALLALALPASAAHAQDAAPPELSDQETVSFAKSGGASADAAPGGSADSTRSGALAYGAPPPRRPVASIFRLTPVVRAGSLPIVRMRIEEAGVQYVQAKVVVVSNATRAVVKRVNVGRVRVGKLTTMHWPRGTRLAAGEYSVRLHARDPEGATLARAANATGRATLSVQEVRPRPRPEISQPQPLPQRTEKVPSSGVFPIAGPFSWGNDESKFGAGRTGHSHQGQDLPAAEGVPVVTPLNGTIAFTDFQKGGAGEYIVINADDGRSLFFAHLKQGSTTVAAGARVAAGSTIAAIGSTGASTGPHLHIEIWEGGWRDRGGKPIDPLPQLQAWTQ